MKTGRETLATTGIGDADTMPVLAAGTSPATKPVASGAMFGRYELRTLIGEGGMGVVWAAHDSALGRMVALKLLRPMSTSAAGELRLRREAQTMARLVHPNVIRVYDVGVEDGNVFVAMEYVVGGTLADWLAREPRSTDDILRTFALAGHGLAAAHDAGLVHRDVKPTNILVSSDDRVLVTDFGLARSASEYDEPFVRGDPTHDLVATLTRTGRILGTPAFMSPEQHEGAVVDARADQFSFCVALWSALYGTRPFAGSSVEELSISVKSGTLTPPPVGARVPPHVRLALERGLATDPAARYSSMHALLDALALDPVRRRRRRRLIAALSIGGVVVAALAAAGITWRLTQSSPAASCDATDRFAGVWDANVRSKLARKALALGKPFAARTFEAVALDLDRQRDSWNAMRRESCEATRVRKEQSDGAMDLRSECLNRRFEEIEGFVGLLENPTAELLDRASERAASAGDVTMCADVTALSRRAPLPRDPRDRQGIVALEQELARYRVSLENEQRVPRATIDDAVARAKAFAYPPVSAAALYVAALDRSNETEHAEARRLLDEALLQAEAGGDDLQRFQIEVKLSDVTGAALEQFADGLRYGELALAVLQRIKASPLRESEILMTLARIRLRKGEFAKARELSERALAISEGIDPRSLDTASQLLTLGVILNESDDPRGSLKVIDRGIEIVQASVGPDHPKIARLLNARGGNLRRLGRLDDAEADYNRALALFRASVGDDRVEVGSVYANLGTLLDKRGDHEGAIALHRQTIAIFERKYGPKHTRTLVAYERLGGTLSKARHDEEAVTILRRVITLQQENLGDNHPFTSNAHFHLGMHYRRAGQLTDALTQLEAAVRSLVGSQGPETRLLSRVYSAIGDTHLDLRRPADAVRSYELALARIGDDASGGERHAGLELALAEALVTAGDRARALPFAESARKRYVALGASAQEDVAEVDAWLAKQFPSQR